jgi:putative spermidine/putrescine transport system substrate-binding protein
MKKMIIVIALVFLLVGCSDSSNEVVPNGEITTKQWNTIIDSAKGTIVNVVYYSEENEVIDWLKNDYRKDIKIKYDIDLRYSFMKFDEIEKLLLDNNEDENMSCEYDLIYLSDGGFKELKEKDLLYKDVLTKLPNYYTNLSDKDYIVQYDQGISIDDYEVPIFKDQLVFINNEDVIYETPVSFDELLDIAKKNKGKITYQNPKNKTGLLFILSAILSKTDIDTMNNLSNDKEKVYEYVKPGIDYLIELDEYLYDGGKTYPETDDDIDTLLREDKVLFSLSRDYNKATENISDSIFPKGCNTFVISDGTTGFVDYFALFKKSGNKAGSLVVMNNMISGETQGNIYENTKLNKLPIVNSNVMPSDELFYIKNVKVKYTSIKYDELEDYFIHEVNNEISKIIYELWSEYVE